MDNWLVTAIAAATTAAAALASSLGGAATSADPAPQSLETTHHRVAPARADAAVAAWTAPVNPVQAAVSTWPARHRTQHPAPQPAAPAPVPASTPPATPAGVASTPRTDDHTARHTTDPARHRAKQHGRHHRQHHHRRHHRHTGKHHGRHHASKHSATRPGRAERTTRSDVRRAPLAPGPLLTPGVPPRRVIGIRHALGMRPAMGALGTDVSWPQCGGSLPMPLAAARFVVIGLTDGPAFAANHCLHRQAAWVRAHHRHVATYAVVSYPNRHELRRLGHRGPYPRHFRVGRLRNVGYHQALVNLHRMHGAGLHSPVVWIDLEESSSHPWRHRTGLNAAVVRGLVHGYRSRGQRIGFYSTASIWRQIVGDLRFGAPEWRTAGPATPHAALGRCHEREATIQGGPAVLAQWWNSRRDHDLLCPGHRDARSMGRWFELPGR